MAGSGAQHLLGRPERIAAAGRMHDRQVDEIDARSGERGGIRQVRRREPDHALAGRGEPRDRRQDDLQLADSLLQPEDLGEGAPRPAAARQVPVEVDVTR